ncbi:MAG: methyltransferase domain-containing protein, partial [Candidatus Zixiibacteriota bacterium]
LSFYLGTEPTSSEAKALTYAHGRILDVGCGPGRILKLLQLHGQDAVGFDIDQVVVALCHERGIKNTFVESYDNIDRFSPVDTVLWLNRTLCTAGSLPRIESLLTSSRLCCSKEGVLIFDSVEVGPELANDGPGVLQTSVHFRYNKKVGEPFGRTCFSSNIAERVLQTSGWKVTDTIRDADVYTMVCKTA